MQKIPVLVAAAGADWEALALERLAAAAPAVVLLKRCVDLQDLLATAGTGQARVALVAHALPGLDADSVSRLRRLGLGVVMVARRADLGPAEEDRLRRLGVEQLLDADSLPMLAQVLAAVGTDAAPTAPTAPAAEAAAAPPVGPGAGRLLAVWGPSGAPGRTTLSVGLAAEFARRGRGTLLVDADPYGGTVAQHLGVLDEVSGMLAAARMANTGELDEPRLSSLARRVGPGLRLLTGLPRADRWAEVRDGPFATLLDQAVRIEPQVVVDTGFSLEREGADPFGGGTPERNAMTLATLERADEIIVVGAADPVGLARLARGLVELLATVPGRRLRVVVNRSRSSLGWGERELRAMIEGFVTAASVHLVPDDRPAADRALVAGRTLVESGDSALRRAVAQVADAVLGGPPAAGTRPRRRFGRRP